MEPPFLALLCFLYGSVTYHYVALGEPWVKGVAAATESQTLVKDMCLCLPFTNFVITHSHFPSVLLS